MNNILKSSSCAHTSDGWFYLVFEEDVFHAVCKKCMEAVSGYKDYAGEMLGSKGGKKGGIARALKLSPERRTEIAKKAANARWGNC